MYNTIANKDVFEHHYQHFLSRRLIDDTSSSIDQEIQIVQKFTGSWVHKLKKMISEVELQRESNTKSDINMLMLTNGIWQKSALKVNIPYDLSSFIDGICADFHIKNPTKKISIDFSYGLSEISIDYAGGNKKIFSCSSLQMVILLLFNTKKIVSCSDMMKQLNLSKDDLSVALLSMAHPSCGVILKNPNRVELEETDKFMINEKFTSQAIKYSIPTLNIKCEKKSSEDDKYIEMQRNNTIDSIIVRFMKSRKQANFNDIISWVISQVSIKFVISQDYIERDEKDRNALNYLA
jgi:hypothetical protein